MSNTDYKFRDFTVLELRPMVKIVQSIGLKKLASVFTQKKDGDDVEEVGMDAFFDALDVLFDNLERVRESVDALIMAVCVDGNAQEIPALPLDKYIGVLESVVFDTNFRDCFTAALRFYNRAKA